MVLDTSNPIGSWTILALHIISGQKVLSPPPNKSSCQETVKKVLAPKSSKQFKKPFLIKTTSQTSYQEGVKKGTPLRKFQPQNDKDFTKIWS